MTYARIAAVPIVVACMYWSVILRGGLWLRWVALAFFVAAAVTDILDGYFARAWGQQSTLGRKIEAYGLLVAFKRLNIGHREIAISFSGSAPNARRIDLADFKARQIGLLGLLKRRTLLRIDARCPFHRLDGRKAVQQILGQMLKIRPGQHGGSAEGPF